MSRKISTSGTLSEKDKQYLAQRAQLSTEQVPVAEQRKLTDLSSGQPVSDLANTGDVNTGGGLGALSTEALERELEARRAAAEGQEPKKLFGTEYTTDTGTPQVREGRNVPREGGPGADQLSRQQADEDDDDDALEPPYDREGVTKADLQAEIARRNEDRPEDDQLTITGNKTELIAVLEADDEDDEE